MGKFDPSSHPDMFELSHGVPANYNMYLRRDVKMAYLKMYHTFNSETNISFPLVSALRNYTMQQRIWNDKWNGKYKDISSPIERAVSIMEWSSMPGSSRHHWGTDIDMFSLDNKDFDHGKGKILYDWLQKNALRFGFAQPYTHNRCAGYNEERWHWSFVNISREFLHDWNILYGAENLCNFVSNVDFDGKFAAASLAPTYVNVINPKCRSP